MLRRSLGVVLCLAAALSAAPPLTTIQDLLYKADGTPFTGTATVEWKSFQSVDTSSIAAQSLTLHIVNGVLRTKLVPTTNATPGAYYLVRYNSDGKIRFTEIWQVPPGAGTVKLKDIRTAAPPAATGIPGAGGVTTMRIADVEGLSSELELRPLKGAGYSAARAAVINTAGELESALGSLTDCVRVDGSSGPCGSGSSGNGTAFVDAEIPGGIVDASNRVFTLLNAPNPPTGLVVYRNGVLQKQTFDYTLSSNAITFIPAAAPQAGDVLLAYYRIGGVASNYGTAQVLCSNTGGSSSSSAMSSIGTCTIPAGLLGAGDRVQISFQYSHEGAATGFSIEVGWGASTLLSRASAANETTAAGRIELAVGPSSSYWNAQSWGQQPALTSTAGAASDPVNVAVPVGFRAQMSSGTAETVSLRGFTVIRYPKQ